MFWSTFRRLATSETWRLEVDKQYRKLILGLTTEADWREIQWLELIAVFRDDVVPVHGDR